MNAYNKNAKKLGEYKKLFATYTETKTFLGLTNQVIIKIFPDQSARSVDLDQVIPRHLEQRLVSIALKNDNY